MTSKPKRPDRFIRDYSIIAILSFTPIPVAYYADLNYIIPIIPIMIITMLPRIWFRDYYIKLNEYRESQYRHKVKSGPQQSSVNENIAQYLSEQIERKSHTKWWQFWR